MALIEAREGKIYYEGEEVVKCQIVDGDPEDEEAGDYVVVTSRPMDLGLKQSPLEINKRDISFEDFERLSVLGVLVEAV